MSEQEQANPTPYPLPDDQVLDLHVHYRNASRADLDRLLGKLRRILFTTSPSKEAAWQLHAHLTTILKSYDSLLPSHNDHDN